LAVLTRVRSSGEHNKDKTETVTPGIVNPIAFEKAHRLGFDALTIEFLGGFLQAAVCSSIVPELISVKEFLRSPGAGISAVDDNLPINFTQALWFPRWACELELREARATWKRPTRFLRRR
jgi:hypothetical protein